MQMELLTMAFYGFIVGIMGLIFLISINIINSSIKTVKSFEKSNIEELNSRINSMKALSRSTEMFMIEQMAMDGEITWDLYMKLNQMEDKEFYEWQKEYFK